MEMTERRVFTIEDPSQAGDVRRSASALAAGLGADVADAGRVALLVTEAATNVVKHGRGGELLLYGGRDGEAWSVGVLAVDRGPGMPDVTSCLEDGMSTFGSAGDGTRRHPAALHDVRPAYRPRPARSSSRRCARRDGHEARARYPSSSVGFGYRTPAKRRAATTGRSCRSATRAAWSWSSTGSGMGSALRRRPRRRRGSFARSPRTGPRP